MADTLRAPPRSTYTAGALPHHDTAQGGPQAPHRCPGALFPAHAHEMSMGGKLGQSERSRNNKPCNALVPRLDRLA